METGFKNRTPEKVSKKKESPWSFECPTYDQRTSCFINAGTHHGVGKAQPIGSLGNPKVEGVPKGRVNTLKVQTDKIFTDELFELEF